MRSVITLAGRIHKKIHDRVGAAWEKTSLELASRARTIRAILSAAGFPLKKQFLILRCAEGEHASGLFSEMAAVLGALEHYEKWSAIYAGLRVDFRDQGLYHEPAAGKNWWEYYFEPIDIGARENATLATIDFYHHDMFTQRAEAMSRARAFQLISRYVRANPRIEERIESYVRENFKGAFVIGVHYRGTDKSEETPRIPYDSAARAIREAVNGAGQNRYKLFVATDEQPFLEYILRMFPGKIVYRESLRSVDGRPTHKTGGNGFKKGEDAVIDCILLSRTDYLIRTPSSLSFCSTLFNPSLPEMLLLSAGKSAG